MDKFILVVIILSVLLVFASLVYDGVACFNNTSYIATVTDKERVVTGNESYYLVFTELENGDVRVFRNVDTWMRGKINSSDVQGKLNVGVRYQFGVAGWRIPMFSKYENIIWFEEVQ